MLKPFTSNQQTQNLQLEVDLLRLSTQQVRLTFTLSGDVTSVLWPEAPSFPARRDQLWAHTCLEAFCAESSDSSAPYTEINCAPNGDWNAYSFSSYREGMTPSSHITVRLEKVEQGTERGLFVLLLEHQLEWPSAFWGLTAVIEFKNQEKSYWSISHPGPAPDFHNKAGWQPLSTH
ncbi:MAG: DOMON-like domain-containing protein [Bdellovibrio sp.]